MFRDKTIRDFTDELASKAPVPGGGGASALAGALGIALGNMVGSLTVGKKKYADVEDDIRALMKRAGTLRKELLDCIDEDAACFEPLAAAYSLPAETDEEKAEKEEVMEKALETACKGPFSIMEKACEAIDIIEEFAEKGSRLAVSDAGAGAALCCAALKAASLNIYINTKMMKNGDTAAAFEEKADSLTEEGSAKADRIFETVKGSLRKG